jgi:hypothetical protein
MMEPDVGELERREIQDHVRKVLRDLGNPEPPVSLADVRALLQLDLKYYDGSDTGLIAELSHRARLLAKKQIPDAVRQVRAILAKSKLLAFWVPDNKRVLIDSSVPKNKHRWIEGHEISHSLAPWHRDFLLGDDRHTLDPVCRAILEAEANYGAGQLLFLQERFAREARDLELSIASVKSLADRYANSITSTLWRFVEERDPSKPVFGMISIHPLVPEIGAHDGEHPWRYFIRSPAFKTQFGSVTPEDAYGLILRHATYRTRGPVLLSHDVLHSVTGEDWEFRIESFCNAHALLTLASAVRKRPEVVVVSR